MCGIKSTKLALRQKMKNIIAQISVEEKRRQSMKVFEKVSMKMERYLSIRNLREVMVSIWLNTLSKDTFLYKQLLCLPKFEQSRRISLYLSTKDEIDTTQILEHVFKENKEVFVPRYKGKEMEMVKLLSMDDYEKLPLTKWNIKQPNHNEPRESAFENGELDLILLPGVAFTTNGKRLGHGMGYYDRFLEVCLKKQQKRPHLIAVAFNEQVLEDIPTTESDILLDLVLTEK